MINYPLSSDTWDQNELDAIQRVVASNRYTMGAEVKKYEQQFAEFMGAKHAVMTNSGSSANLITLATLGLHPMFKKSLKEDPHVIVPAVSWSTTYFPVHQWGFKLKFVDVDRYTFNISVPEVIKAIDHNTVAVFAVNLLGSAAELVDLKRICDNEKIILIEDNCESLGAKLDGKHCGTYGVMGTFSFFFSHHLQTMEGGMVLTNDDELVDYLRSIRAHGWVRDLSEDSKLYTKQDPFTDSFKFVLPGYCVRPLEMSGATGQEQLKKWPEMLKVRRQNAKVAQKHFIHDDFYLQQEKGESSWFGFGLVLRNRLVGRRSDVVKLLRSQNVECRPIVTGNFTKNPVIDLLNHTGIQNYPAADTLDTNGFFIGNDSIDLEEKIIAVADLLKNFK